MSGRGGWWGQDWCRRGECMPAAKAFRHLLVAMLLLVLWSAVRCALQPVLWASCMMDSTCDVQVRAAIAARYVAVAGARDESVGMLRVLH